MKAAVFLGAKDGVIVREVEDPQPGPGEVRVRVAACGVCHTDLHYVDHGTPTFKAPPVVLGHEAAGWVDRHGPDSDEPPVGTPVLVPPVISCGACVACRTGRENVCERMRMFGNHMDGAFAEYVIVPRKDLVVLPEDLPLEEACVIADAVATPFHAVVRRGGVAPGDRVAVVGVGGVGVNAVQIAAAVGARVVALDLDERRLARARELGAEEVVRADDPKEAAKRVRAWSQGGVPVAFECVGKPETIRLAHSLVRVGGRLVLVGYCEPPAEIGVARIMFFEQEIVGSLGCRPVDFPRVVELVRRGRVRLAPLITARVGLDRVHDAFEHVRRGEGLRAVVVP